MSTIDAATIFRCYKANGASVFLQAGDGVIWDMGPESAVFGNFTADASAWFAGEWEPGEVNGQTPTDADGLVPVAEWSSTNGLRLLVDPEHLGSASAYVTGHHH